MNLISNSYKFTNQGSIDIHIHFKIRPEHESRNQRYLEFTVTDTGIGISKEQSKNLFKMFNVVKRDTLNIRGTGLGLTISKKLVELLGGTIEVTSEELKGTSISFTIKENQEVVYVDCKFDDE